MSMKSILMKSTPMMKSMNLEQSLVWFVKKLVHLDLLVPVLVLDLSNHIHLLRQPLDPSLDPSLDPFQMIINHFAHIFIQMLLWFVRRKMQSTNLRCSCWRSSFSLPLEDIFFSLFFYRSSFSDSFLLIEIFPLWVKDDFIINSDKYFSINIKI